MLRGVVLALATTVALPGLATAAAQPNIDRRASIGPWHLWTLAPSPLNIIRKSRSAVWGSYDLCIKE